MCFVLFALSPCLFKGAVLFNTDVNTTKPLNVTKTTTLSSACQFVNRSNKTQLVSKFVKNTSLTKTTKPFLNIYLISNSSFFGNKFSFFSKSSIPIYILFKRLKLHL